METDILKYDQMVENAMRGVVRSALMEIAENGLPGNHHFYISFLTHHPGVEMAEYLKEMNPEEITIVIQHKFWGLEIGEDSFEVTLSFNKINERLRVPFSAITAFTDPSANFGLQFRGLGESEDDSSQNDLPVGEMDLDTLRGTGSQIDEVPLPSPAAALKDQGPSVPAGESAGESVGESVGESAKDEDNHENSGEVITLDAFRKKTRKT